MTSWTPCHCCHPFHFIFQKILCNWNAISHWFGFRNWKEDNVAKIIPGILWISDKYHQYPRISCKMLIYVESKVFPVSNIFIAYLLLWIVLDFFASFNCSVGDALCLFLFVHFFINMSFFVLLLYVPLCWVHGLWYDSTLPSGNMLCFTFRSKSVTLYYYWPLCC